MIYDRFYVDDYVLCLQGHQLTVLYISLSPLRCRCPKIFAPRPPGHTSEEIWPLWVPYFPEKSGKIDHGKDQRKDLIES